MAHHLPDGYRSQLPARYTPAPGGPTWQPDVIPLAAELADQRGARRLIDVGCSTAAKLLPFADRFDLIGLDLPDQLPDDDRGTWIGADLEAPGPLPLTPGQLAGAVLVCADVIEHLEHPEHLARALAEACRHAAGLVLSTPDRDRLYGPGHLGPPRNPCHAREWTADELVGFLLGEGVPVTRKLWQRANDRTTEETTTVVLAWSGVPVLAPGR